MTATSAWVMMFAPKEVGGAKWVTLEKELAAPIDSSSLTQLGEQTKRLLEAMGFECAAVPSKVALAVWDLSEVSSELTKWKRKLKDAFGVRVTSTVRKLGDVDPSTVPLPTTPKKSSMDPLLRTPDTKRNVFSKTTDSPYFMDSHMVTPKKDRENRRIAPAGSIGDDDDNDFVDEPEYADPCEDLAAQQAVEVLRDPQPQ
ncbi:Eukaryotic/viral aspartic protease [Phytophthora cinnamomi]|uniref:Eukaryotic/viral aspartic protease n=1 Tax=Phytophthora cinnamomi TaxID=4785 RepID=UPI00355A11F8|nr:Eukaryotic/viral aspartic protease [Phytophthora cinnamomi]